MEVDNGRRLSTEPLNAMTMKTAPTTMYETVNCNVKPLPLSRCQFHARFRLRDGCRNRESSFTCKIGAKSQITQQIEGGDSMRPPPISLDARSLPVGSRRLRR